MLITSQPLNTELSEKYEVKSKAEIDAMTEQNICSQYIGSMFDDLVIIKLVSDMAELINFGQ